MDPQDTAPGDDWVGLTSAPLPAELTSRWAVRPDCGAVVSFWGTVRDHAPGRPGVESLEYEAFEEEVERKMADVVAEARRRWPPIGRVALLHRTGTLEVGEPAVVVTVAAPHRAEAFEAARYVIDTAKAALPIWKRERWAGGDDWSGGAVPVADLPSGAVR